MRALPREGEIGEGEGVRPVTPSNSFAVREGEWREERGFALSVAPRLHFNGNEVTGARADADRGGRGRKRKTKGR